MPCPMHRDRINHPPHSIARCRELIAVAVSQIDGDPIVGDRVLALSWSLRALVARMNGIVEIDAGENGENVGL
jgi:hypothetical protein